MALSVGMSMAQFEEDFGEVASPEWYEDDWWL